MGKGGMDKGAGLAWFRLQCDKPLPEGKGLKDLPMGHVFPQSGLASFSTHLGHTPRSAMFSFRSSPYGSTSHALANQNAFTTFWAGEAIFTVQDTIRLSLTNMPCCASAVLVPTIPFWSMEWGSASVWKAMDGFHVIM